MAITGMIFSPVGEELFFRGIVHSSFAKSIGDFKELVDEAELAVVVAGPHAVEHCRLDLDTEREGAIPTTSVINLLRYGSKFYTF